jgi:hypothetical protein
MAIAGSESVLDYLGQVIVVRFRRAEPSDDDQFPCAQQSLMIVWDDDS